MNIGPVLISACILGLRTRYDGSGAYDEAALNDAGTCLVPVCPEQLGGLPTPRKPAFIEGGTGEDVLRGRAVVVDTDGKDVTAAYVRGAEEVARIARITGARRAVLKEKSPSCGVGLIYRGARLCPGMGVTAALLRAEGIETKGY